MPGSATSEVPDGRAARPAAASRQDASGWQVSASARSAAPSPRGTGAEPSPSRYAAEPAGLGSQGTVEGPTMAAVTGAASSARGLASKLGASFSGLAKPKPSPKVPPPGRPAGPPGAAGSRPPQQPPGSRSPQPGQTRRALLSLERIEPMSVMKFSFLISLAAWVIMFIAIAVIYFALSKLGVFAKLEQTWGLVTYNKSQPANTLTRWFSASRILEYTALVCTVNAILFTALATIGAALYNLVANLTGGIEVTLRESD